MTHYHVKNYPRRPKPPYVMARLFVVTDTLGAHCVEHKSIVSRLIQKLPQGRLFHGEHDGENWVARLRSEGGGYCYRGAVQEVE